MEEKLRKLMKHEGINSTRLADMLGIQASGISHIMSGRNKPSFDFLVKLLHRFPRINPDWLLLDKGAMYRDEIKAKMNSTIGVGEEVSPVAGTPVINGGLFSLNADTPASMLDRDDNDIIPAETSTVKATVSRQLSDASPSSIERIVVFNKDKTFTEYQPG